MSSTPEVEYFASRIPMDEELLAPLGLVTWAASRLHHVIRDVLGLDLGEGLSNEPFDPTLGGVMSRLEKRALSVGEPWSTAIGNWSSSFGRPAVALRDSTTHVIAFTAEDGRPAIRTSYKSSGNNRQRVTKALLTEAAGSLELAGARLHGVREACRKASGR